MSADQLATIVRNLLRYSFEDVEKFDDLTPTEKTIVGTKQNFEALRQWVGGRQS